MIIRSRWSCNHLHIPEQTVPTTVGYDDNGDTITANQVTPEAREKWRDLLRKIPPNQWYTPEEISNEDAYAINNPRLYGVSSKIAAYHLTLKNRQAANQSGCSIVLTESLFTVDLIAEISGD